MKRVHIFGAAGTGTTTLGRSLAQTLQWKHYEADDFLWLPTAPPYQQQRPREERTRQLQEALAVQEARRYLIGYSHPEGVSTAPAELILKALRML